MAAVTHTVRRSVQSRIVSSVAPQRPPPTYPAWVRLPAREDSLNGVGDGTTEVAVVLMSLPELWGDPRDTRADGRHVVVGGDVMATISSGSTPTIPSRRPTAMPARSLPAAQCSSTGRQGAVAATCRMYPSFLARGWRRPRRGRFPGQHVLGLEDAREQLCPARGGSDDDGEGARERTDAYCGDERQRPHRLRDGPGDGYRCACGVGSQASPKTLCAR